MLIESILLKLLINVQRCTSSPNQSTAMQFADVSNVLPHLQAWLKKKVAEKPAAFFIQL